VPQTFNREKFEELIVYIARRLGPEAALGRVKLAKLLMVADFSAFLQLGKPMTGATYEKWEHGHLPRELLLVQRDLEAEGAIEVEAVDYYGKTLKHVTARRDPRMADFSEDEIGIIESGLLRFGYQSATYLSQLAHQELGWLLASEKEVIPYETALLEASRPPDAVFAEFRALHGLAA
jgi:hypothetical protein